MVASSWSKRLGANPFHPVVGRDAELAQLRAFAAGEADGFLLYIHGAPGTGKTVLVREWVRTEIDAGRRVALFDAFIESYPEPAEVLARVSDVDLVVLDDFHHLAPLESWFFDVFLPQLAGRARVVVTSRRPPRAHERAAIELVELGPLPAAACHAYLEAREVPATSRGAVLEFARGLALWLGIGADLALAVPERPFAAAARERLEPLVEALLDEAAAAGHRDALYAMARLFVVTEHRLEVALAAPAADAFRWLCGRPYVQRTAQGICLHDAVRDAILADLAWRNPEMLRAMSDRVYPMILDGVRRATGDARHHALVEMIRMIRDEPGGAYIPGTGEPPFHLDAVHDDELPMLLDAIRRHEGDGSMRLAERWFAKERDRLVGFRDESHALVAFILYVPIEPTAPAVPDDPFVTTLLAHIERDAPFREGERAFAARWWMSLEDHQAAGPLLLVLFAHTTWRLVLEPDGEVCTASHTEPEVWAARGDRAHDLFGTFTLDGRSFGIFGHDWRRTSRERWFEGFVTACRGLAAPPPSVAELDVLARAAFADAVKSALRDFGRADRLAESPLLRTRLVAGSGVDGLRTCLCETVAALDPRSAEVLDHAFLRKEEKGIAVAAKLGMPFGTYRRILNDAVQRLIDALWTRDRERASVPRQ